MNRFEGTLAVVVAIQMMLGVQASDFQVKHWFEQVGDVKVLYREAVKKVNPTVLLHGYAASSFMYRNLIPMLADKYHVVGPDLSEFGFTEAPARGKYA